MGWDQNHSKEIDIYNRTFKEKMQIVGDFKEKGNQYFKEDNYEKASYFYAKALLQFYYIIPEDDAEEAIVKPVQLACHVNQAIWYQKQKRYDEGLTEWYQALNIDPNNVKALYRQATLNREKHNFEKAQNDIKKGLEIEPNNKALIKLKKELNKDIELYVKKSKKVYSKMLEKQEIEQQEAEQSEPPKVVELNEEDELNASTQNVTISEPTNSNINIIEEVKSNPESAHSSIEEVKSANNPNSELSTLIERVDKIEEIVTDLKFTMDILKGYGAIPPKMPDDDEKKEIEQRYKNSNKSKKSKVQPRFLDDWIAITALLLLSVILSVSLTVFIMKTFI